MNITVFVDSSGSMTVQGKETICVYLVQSLSLLNKLDARFKNVNFNFQNCEPSSTLTEKLKITSEKTLFITDGFELEYIENCNVAIILVGADSKNMSAKNYFKAKDLLNAVDFLYFGA